MKKKMCSLLLVLAILVSVSASAFAQGDYTISDEPVDFYDEAAQNKYIEVNEYIESEELSLNLSYETFLETYYTGNYETIPAYVDSISEETYDETLLLEEPVDETLIEVETGELNLVNNPTEEEFAQAYDELNHYLLENAIVARISYETFKSEYYAINCVDIEDYLNRFYSMLEISGEISTYSTGGKWWNNTGMSLPQSASYSSYNLLGTVKPGDIIFEANGLGGLTGHIAIVEGTYYSSTYNQFYVRVIEAILAGVCRGVLDDTRVDNKDVFVLRITGMTQSQANGAVNFCISQLGKDYYLDFAHDTSSSSDDWYCSELIYAAYMSQGLAIIESGDSNDEIGITPRDTYLASNTYTVSFKTSKPASVLTDISSNWANTYITYVVNNGVMTGITSTTFSPETTSTRSVVISAIYKLAGSPTTVYSEPFTDVTTSSAAYHAIAWGYYNGIVTGTTSTVFSPSASVTREQLATFLYRFATHMGYSTSYSSTSLSAFTDTSDIDSYALTPMKWAVTHGLITGRTSTTLEPDGTLTRAEWATIIYRFVNELM